MKCEDCERIEPLIFDHTTLWIYTPTTEAHGDVIQAFHGSELPVTDLGARAISVAVPRADVDRLLAVLQTTLKGPELAHTKILTTEGPTLLPHDISRVLQADVFINRHESGWIVELLEADSFETWYQPIVSAGDPDAARPYALEGLFRMKGRDGSIIPPGRVFGLAGSSDLLFTVDLIARRSAVECAARAKADARLFINFNPSAIYDPAYCLRTTAAAIKEIGLDPSRIVFELTETHRARDENHLKRILEFYRSAGFGVALDDIGSGYSGLNMLHEYKPDYVKLDMDLVRDVDTDPFKQTIVRHLIEIARTLDILTIGEGVETQQEADWLIQAGIHLMQGFHFGKPAPLRVRTDGEEAERIRRAGERFNARAAEIAQVAAAAR